MGETISLNKQIGNWPFLIFQIIFVAISHVILVWISITSNPKMLILTSITFILCILWILSVLFEFREYFYIDENGISRPFYNWNKLFRIQNIIRYSEIESIGIDEKTIVITRRGKDIKYEFWNRENAEKTLKRIKPFTERST